MGAVDSGVMRGGGVEGGLLREREGRRFGHVDFEEGAEFGVAAGVEGGGDWAAKTVFCHGYELGCK